MVANSVCACAGSVATVISSTVISRVLFVIRPRPRAGTEIVDRSGAVLVGLDVDQDGGAGGKRLLAGACELGRIAHGEGLCAQCARKARPVVIGNAGQFR